MDKRQDADTSTATVVGGAGAPFSSKYTPMYAVLALLPMLVLTAGGAGETGVLAWTVVLMVLFAVCSPLRDGVPGRVIAFLAGAVSLCIAGTGLMTDLLSGSGDRAATSIASMTTAREVAWFAGVGGLLVVLIVVSFIRQMAREERSHLIRGLSHSVLDGVALIAASGWMFLPDYMALPDAGADNTAMIASAIVVALLFVGLAVASNWWMAEADPDEHAIRPWIGIVVLPTLLSGVLVPIATVLVALA